MNEVFELSRLRWQCRRGMLELDLLFLAFFDQVFKTLPHQQQMAFKQLLEQSDQTLYDWLVKRQPVTDPELAQIVALIVDNC